MEVVVATATESVRLAERSPPPDSGAVVPIVRLVGTSPAIEAESAASAAARVEASVATRPAAVPVGSAPTSAAVGVAGVPWVWSARL